jgi:hypothetical protein
LEQAWRGGFVFGHTDTLRKVATWPKIEKLLFSWQEWVAYCFVLSLASRLSPQVPEQALRNDENAARRIPHKQVWSASFSPSSLVDKGRLKASFLDSSFFSRSSFLYFRA